MDELRISELLYGHRAAIERIVGRRLSKSDLEFAFRMAISEAFRDGRLNPEFIARPLIEFDELSAELESDA